MPPLAVLDARDARMPRPRGWARYTIELLRAFDAGAADGRVGIRGLGGAGGLLGPRLPEVAWEQVGLPARAAALGADVLHAPSCFLPLRRPCAGVVTVHDLAWEAFPEDFAPRTRAKFAAITPRAVASAERVIVDAAFTRDDLVARYGADPGRIRVVPLAPSLARGRERSPEGPYLVSIGDLRPKKNHLALVRAWRALRREGLPHDLVIAGIDAGEGDRLEAAAGDEPLELAGWMAEERLDALLRGADLLVHPSRYEGFGLPLVEAMARDVPVACADRTSLPEVAAGAAELFDPDDEADIARAIRRVLEDPGRAADLVARGRGRVAQLSWAATATATADVYLEAISLRR